MKNQTLTSHELNLILPFISEELKARYFYEIASSFCRANGYNNAEVYYKKQASEETEHYNKWIDFISDWISKVDFPNIDKPNYDINSLSDIIDIQYELEYNLLKLYNKGAMDSWAVNQTIYSIMLEFVVIQNNSVVEVSTLVSKRNNYLQIDPNLVLFEHESFN